MHKKGSYVENTNMLFYFVIYVFNDPICTLELNQILRKIGISSVMINQILTRFQVREYPTKLTYTRKSNLPF